MTSVCTGPFSATEERDLVHLARILENSTLDAASGRLSSRFYDIGDAGCSLLFRYLDGEIDPVEVEGHASQGDALRSPKMVKEQWTMCDPTDPLLPPHQAPKQFTAVDLWSVGMSDPGFSSLISWLANRASDSKRTTLRSLDLRRNLIIGTSGMARDLVQSFSSTPMSQCLQTLVLSNNPLSPAFRRTLISLLHNIPSLRELSLSMTGMTSKDGKALGKYFSHKSPPCRLVKFDANANQLGIKGIRHIVHSLRHCYSLEAVELYANSDEGLMIGGSSSEGSDEDSSSSEIANAASYRMLEQVRSRYLMRNYYLKSIIKDQALELLKATRVLLSRPDVVTHSKSGSSIACDFQDLTIDSPSFFTLPNELKFAILSALAPELSHRQFMRIIEYGSSRQTLPKVGLSLPTRQLSPRPPPAGPTTPRKFGSLVRTTTTSPSAHSNSTTSIVPTEKDKQVQEWLVRVGCDVYERNLHDGPDPNHFTPYNNER